MMKISKNIVYKKELILSDVIIVGKGVVWGKLQKVFGIGLRRARVSCTRIGVYDRYNFRKLEYWHFEMLRKMFLNNFYLGDRLRWECKRNMYKYTESFSKRGLLYLSGLPVNGQRSKTNGQTSKKDKIRRMLVFGNRQMEAIINGKKAFEKPSRRIRKLKKKVLSITRVF